MAKFLQAFQSRKAFSSHLGNLLVQPLQDWDRSIRVAKQDNSGEWHSPPIGSHICEHSQDERGYPLSRNYALTAECHGHSRFARMDFVTGYPSKVSKLGGSTCEDSRVQSTLSGRTLQTVWTDNQLTSTATRSAALYPYPAGFHCTAASKGCERPKASTARAMISCLPAARSISVCQ